MIITKGLGGMVLITKGFSGTIFAEKVIREVVRLRSYITTEIKQISKIWQ